jgi:16S rRNA (cytosine967-C5)-methyltransferase
MTAQATAPRDFALLELDAKRLPNWPANSLKKRNPPEPPTDSRDRALAENITIGVIKNLLLLQHLIQHYSGKSLKSIDPPVQKILAIALYQLRFLDRIPASAAVDQAVEQTRRFRQSKAAGFVNAILRKATRDPAPPLPSRDSPTEYARIVLSHPPELFTSLERLLGADDALKFCEHDQSEPPTIVRLSRGADPAALVAEGVVITPHEQSGVYVVAGAKRATLAQWAAQGIAQVQDPTAAAVVSCLRTQPGETVLDRCAGLGTKTLQLREAVGETGRIVAIDPAPPRCQGLQHLLDQRKITNVIVHCAAWLKDVPNLPKHFDRILADVPCSNSGVLARRPEARYTQNPQALASLANLQDQILEDSAPHVAPSGLLVYSTCSVWPKENEQRIQHFLARHPEFQLDHQQTTLPSFDDDAARYRDGGYVAVLRRRSAPGNV